MWESILKLGELVEDSIPIAEVREGYLAKVIFDLDKKEVYLGDRYELRGDKAREIAREYLWIGNAKGNRKQVRLTTDNVNYILDSDKGHKWCIGATIDYIEEKGLINDNDIRELYEYLVKIRSFSEKEKEKLKRLKKEKDDTLFTISVKEKGETIDLAKLCGYRKIVDRLLMSESKESKLVDGVCHVCGRKGKVLTNPDYSKGKILAIYVQDKRGFISDFGFDDESKLRSHVVCEECKQKLEKGVEIIEQKLSSSVGNLRVYVIPSSLSGEISRELLTACMDAFEVASSRIPVTEALKKIQNVEEELRILEAHSNVFLNLVFGRPVQSKFEYYGTIFDVPPKKLLDFAKRAAELGEEFSRYFKEESSEWYLNFESIVGLIPQPRNTVPRRVLEILNSLLKDIPYPQKQLMRTALLVAKIHRFGNYQSYGYEWKRVEGSRKRDIAMCRDILKFEVLRRLLNMPSRTKISIPNEFGVKDKELEDLLNFCEKQGYEEWQVALFLLGVLIGKIGHAQFRKGDEKKAILNKIDFDGMGKERIIRLVNDVFEGLRNYRILTYNEEKFAICKLLIDRNILNLVDPVSNVFYILSGYAYETLKIMGGVKSEE